MDPALSRALSLGIFRQPEDICSAVRRLAAEAQRVGFPLLVKAVMGGGGKGMKLAMSPADFEVCALEKKTSGLGIQARL